MQRTIILQSTDDLMYIAGALVNGTYKTKSYEKQTVYEDTSNNRCKFNLIFKVQNSEIIDLEQYFNSKQ